MVELEVRKINDKIAKIAEELAKEKGVQCESSLIEQKNGNYEQQITFVYECKVNKEKWRDSININYVIYKTNGDYRIKILLDDTQICDRKLKNFSKEIERKIREKLDKHLSEIIEKWKRQENIIIVENEIAQAFEAFLGVKPKVKFYDSLNSFYAVFEISKNISIVVSGRLNNNELSINRIEIESDNDLTNKLEQIAEIYKAMIAFL